MESESSSVFIDWIILLLRSFPFSRTQVSSAYRIVYMNHIYDKQQRTHYRSLGHATFDMMCFRLNIVINDIFVLHK